MNESIVPKLLQPDVLAKIEEECRNEARADEWRQIRRLLAHIKAQDDRIARLVLSASTHFNG